MLLGLLLLLMLLMRKLPNSPTVHSGICLGTRIHTPFFTAVPEHKRENQSDRIAGCLGGLISCWELKFHKIQFRIKSLALLFP